MPHNKKKWHSDRYEQPVDLAGQSDWTLFMAVIGRWKKTYQDQETGYFGTKQWELESLELFLWKLAFGTHPVDFPTGPIKHRDKSKSFCFKLRSLFKEKNIHYSRKSLPALLKCSSLGWSLTVSLLLKLAMCLRDYGPHRWMFTADSSPPYLWLPTSHHNISCILPPPQHRLL